MPSDSMSQSDHADVQLLCGRCNQPVRWNEPHECPKEKEPSESDTAKNEG
jgi:hypothetical protein